MVTGAMTVAIGKVHAKNGFWLADGGMEYNRRTQAGDIGVTLRLVETAATRPAAP